MVIEINLYGDLVVQGAPLGNLASSVRRYVYNTRSVSDLASTAGYPPRTLRSDVSLPLYASWRQRLAHPDLLLSTCAARGGGVSGCPSGLRWTDLPLGCGREP